MANVMKSDIYTQVTNQIIAAIEKGAPRFQMPWHRRGRDHFRPHNIDTGNDYQGINVLALWAAAEVRGYCDGTWGTYRQWQKRGFQVRKGEKASLVVFYKEFAIDEDQRKDGQDNGKRMMARASYVFNAAQVDGYIAEENPLPGPGVDTLEQADAFVRATNAKVAHGGQRAFYNHMADAIQMPEQSSFIGSDHSSATESYYSTLLHELTHWTGHRSRLDRLSADGFGTAAYAEEELVAELGAAFLCSDLEIAIEPRVDHAAYIDGWLKVLKSDNRAIFKASRAATQAVQFLKGLQS